MYYSTCHGWGFNIFLLFLTYHQQYIWQKIIWFLYQPYYRAHPPRGRLYTLCCIMDHHDQYKGNMISFTSMHEHQSFCVVCVLKILLTTDSLHQNKCGRWLGHVYIGHQWPWPSLSKFSQHLRNEWWSHFVLITLPRQEWWVDRKVTWDPTYSWLENVWWLSKFCGERTQIGCLSRK